MRQALMSRLSNYISLKSAHSFKYYWKIILWTMHAYTHEYSLVSRIIWGSAAYFFIKHGQST